MTLIFLFALLILGTGLNGLYQHFHQYGIPHSIGEILNSSVLISTLLVVTGAGLLKAKSWSRTFALGICYGTIAGALIFLIYAGFNLQTIMMTIGLFLMAFQKYTTFISHSASTMVFLGISLLFSLGIAISLVRALRSSAVIERYGEDDWFGQELLIGEFDSKPLIMAGVFLFFSYFDSLMPRQLHRSYDQKVTEVAIQDFKQALEKDPKYLEEKKQQELTAQKAADDKMKANFLQFTSDETKLWIVSSDQKLHLYDLTTWTSQIFDFGSFSSHKQHYLSWDGEHFFNEDTAGVVKTKDKMEMKIPAQTKFLGFTADPNEVLLFHLKENKLIRYRFSEQREIWSKPLDSSSQSWTNSTKWSYDRHAFFAGEGKKFFLLNVDDGTITHHDLAMRYPEFSFTNPDNFHLIVSGPVEFDEVYKSYEINPETMQINEIPRTEAITGYSSALKSFLSYRYDQLKVIARDPAATDRTVKIGYGQQIYLGSSSSEAFLLGGNRHQVELMNIETQAKKPMGRTFSDERPLESPTCQSTISPHGNLIAVVCRKSAEVFWVAQFTQESPRTWQFEVPISPSR